MYIYIYTRLYTNLHIGCAENWVSPQMAMLMIMGTTAIIVHWILGVIAPCSDKPIYTYIYMYNMYTVYTIKGPRLPKLIMTLSSRLTTARAHSSVRVAAMFLRSMSKGPLKKKVF